MVTLVRRFLVLVALMFWQGGFTFYAAVVVPVGQSVLGSHLDQGFITREVTNYLNLAGAVALLLLAWDVAAAPPGRGGHQRLRWLAWGGLAVTLVALCALHPRLDTLLDVENHNITDGRPFRSLHRTYLWVSTVQWAFAVAYTGLTLVAWREVDGRAIAAQTDS
jgi:hypothetical protein